ncbi:hypothetical protein RCH23_002267 [Cryobacterium sp. CAN_C3]|nr:MULTISPECIES: hypothetical protein [unclassified Cryobacterium]MEC5154879.1 hypothetical protein [Cryobacterium sp. CAN_C3]
MARACNPERFTTDRMPKILAIPTNAWINKTEEKVEVKLVA